MNKALNHIKKYLNQTKSKEYTVLAMFWLFVCVIAVISGSQRFGVSNFSPINGDFQNYNVVRRFISGQVPFKDFTVYLGFGHMLILSLPQFLFGNNFVLSVVIANATVFICFALFWYAISNLILKDSIASVLLTTSFCFLNLLRPDFFTRLLDANILGAFDEGITPGVSAKIIRLAIIPLLLLFLSRYFEKETEFENFKYKSEMIVAAIAGISVIWSNDGGIGWFLAFSFFYALLHFKYKGISINLAKSAILYVSTSALSLFTFLTIVTYGTPLSYFERSLGVSSYQKWYFGGLRPSSLFDIDFNFYTAICVALLIFFTIMFIRTKPSNPENATYFWLSCVMFALYTQATLYYYYNGVPGNNRIMYLCAFIIIVAYSFKFLRGGGYSNTKHFIRLFLLCCFCPRSNFVYRLRSIMKMRIICLNWEGI